MKNMKYLFYFLISFLLLLPATSSFAGIDLGPLSIGGAIRANYVIGDYGDGTDPSQHSRAESDGGKFFLDVFRVNLDYSQDAVVAKAEYRFYGDYSMLHTGWVGYNFEDASQVQVGVNRVPFGPGAYGVSQSFFFDQHYYVGLSDDMDLGVKYSKTFDKLALDVAYYAMDEGSYVGATKNAARYSYDAVDNEAENGFEERHQFNVRAIYPIEMGDGVTTDLGASLQYGLMESNGDQDDGDHYAGSLHAVTSVHNLKIAAQMTYYEYGIEDAAGNSLKSVNFGAFDYYTGVAAEAMIPAISLSYYQETPQVDWLEYVIPYVEYSTILKEEDGFNDSELVDIGAAWGSGGWYIYTDLVFSNGNDFVGNESGWQRFASNPDDTWEYRFNINFGYYF